MVHKGRPSADRLGGGPEQVRVVALSVIQAWAPCAPPRPLASSFSLLNGSLFPGHGDAGVVATIGAVTDASLGHAVAVAVRHAGFATISFGFELIDVLTKA